MTETATPSEDSTGDVFDAAAHAESMVGHHYRVDDYYEVGREKVREYARAVQDFHPVHWDEDAAKESGHDALLAPLTFISLVGMIATKRLFETIVTGYDISQIMQTDQVLEFHRPIKVGDRLVCDVYLHSFRRAPKGADIIVTKNIVTGENDELIQTAFTTIVGRANSSVDAELTAAMGDVLMNGAAGTSQIELPRTVPEIGERAVPEALAPEPVAPGKNVVRFDDVSVGDELPPRIVKLTRGDLVNYAGVSGDPNPIHWSDDVAKAVGIDNVVAHGMLTMGLGAGFITSWLGDPGAVKDYSVRMTSMVYVDPHEPAEIEYTGKIKSVDPETRTAVVAMTGKFRGKRIFGRATATVQLG